MATKRKETRSKTSREPTEPSSAPSEAAFRSTYELFLVLRALGSAARRREGEKLAKALDHEALDIFRVARRLQDRRAQDASLEELATNHGLSSILERLDDFAPRLVQLARLTDLGDQLGRGSESWYQQGALLLDAADRLRADITFYEITAAARPPNERGTVAWSYLVEEAKRWGLTNEQLARRLKDVGYVRTDDDFFDLTENVKKHRQRRSEPVREPRRRKRRSKPQR